MRGVGFPYLRATRFLSLAALAATIILTTADPADARRRKRTGGYAPPYAALVVDVKTGRVLHQTAPDALRHPASVTKVMTLYLLFEEMERGRYTVDTPLRISANAARQAPSKIGLEAGETIRVEDAIKALVTKSANDIAVAVAENLAGSEEAFAERMTKKARSLGMNRSVFVNASGLPDAEQVTTARDLVRLGIAIQERFPKQYRYFATRGFEFEGAYFRNHNKLLGRIEAVDGIKTGYTRMSGFNLLTSARADGRQIVAVVLGGRSGRSRDAVMAGLVHSSLPRAFAGRRTAEPVVAAADEEAGTPAPRRLARTAPLPPAPPAPPEPTLRAPSLTATAAVLGQVTPPPRPVGAPVDLRNIRPAVATAKGTPPTPGSAVSVRLPEPPPAPLAPPAPAAGPAGKGGHRLVAPSDAANPLAFTGPREIAPPRPPLDLKPTGTVRLAATGEGEDDEEAPAARKPLDRRVVAAPAKPEEPAKAAPAAPTPVAAAPTPTPAAANAWVIQLAAPDDKAKALEILERAKSRLGSSLANARPFTEPVQKGGATLWRARFAGFDNDGAQAACRELKRSGFSCFATRA